jgi:hypothetical protein
MDQGWEAASAYPAVLPVFAHLQKVMIRFTALAQVAVQDFLL